TRGTPFAQPAAHPTCERATAARGPPGPVLRTLAEALTSRWETALLNTARRLQYRLRSRPRLLPTTPCRHRSPPGPSVARVSPCVGAPVFRCPRRLHSALSPSPRKIFTAISFGICPTSSSP